MKERIRELALSLGFNRLVVASPAPMPEALDTYSAWLERGFSADMEYLKRDPQRRVTPSMTFAPARSILIVSVNYYNSPPPPPENMVWGRVAGYAVGLDYHNVLRAKLRDLFALIEKEVGHPLSRRAVTDDAALFEQALAARHGLGFVGKHTLIIGPKLSGSYNLIGELFLDLDLEPDEPYVGTCGDCFRCGKACPTGAIVPATEGSGYVVDANACLSYLTIENKGGIAPAMRAGLGDWVFGCDICQDVCPYNSKPVASPWPEFKPERGAGHYLDLLGLFDAVSEEEFRARFLNSPLRRPRLRGLRRNALVVLGNKLRDGKVELAYLRHRLAAYLESEEDEMLLEHAAWALCQGRDKPTALLESFLPRIKSTGLRQAVVGYLEGE